MTIHQLIPLSALLPHSTRTCPRVRSAMTSADTLASAYPMWKNMTSWRLYTSRNRHYAQGCQGREREGETGERKGEGRFVTCCFCFHLPEDEVWRGYEVIPTSLFVTVLWTGVSPYQGWSVLPLVCSVLQWRETQPLCGKPFRNWKKAVERFDEHFLNKRHNSGDSSASSKKKHGTGHQHHQICAATAKDFLCVREAHQEPVNVQMDNDLDRRKRKNMRVLETTVETVLLCGQQNCALQGHRDDEKHEEAGDGNIGNFHAFFKYRINGSDTDLKEHFQNATKNATY